MYCLGLMSPSLFSDILATRITLYLLTGKSCRLSILTCLKPTSLASMALLSVKFYSRHRSSHPKTSFNSLTPHRNNISGQQGSKPRVSEHESSAPPFNMYGTTSLPWCVFISTFIYEVWLILELVNEWIGSLTSYSTIFQLYMWRHMDLCANQLYELDLRSGSLAIDISLDSLRCPSKHRHVANLFKVNQRNCKNSVAFYDAHGNTEDISSS